MNIVMNVPDLELGSNLQAFKNSTCNLTPPYRGQKLGENQFIRGVHNSFLRRSEMLLADSSLQEDFEKWEKAIKAPKRKASKAGKKKQQRLDNDDDTGGAFHFIAYVPIDGEVWRLDGMQHEPENLGKVRDDWIAVARENIMSRIAQYNTGKGNNLEYSLVSITRCPLRLIIDQIAHNLNYLTQVEASLNANVEDWQAFIDSAEIIGPLQELGPSFDLTSADISQAQLSNEDKEKIEKALSQPGSLIELYKSLAQEYSKLNAKYMDVVIASTQEQEIALQRKRDDTPLIYEAIKALSEAGILGDIIWDMKQ